MFRCENLIAVTKFFNIAVDEFGSKKYRCNRKILASRIPTMHVKSNTNIELRTFVGEQHSSTNKLINIDEDPLDPCS